jgi:hypothetical protein
MNQLLRKNIKKYLHPKSLLPAIVCWVIGFSFYFLSAAAIHFWDERLDEIPRLIAWGIIVTYPLAIVLIIGSLIPLIIRVGSELNKNKFTRDQKTFMTFVFGCLINVLLVQFIPWFYPGVIGFNITAIGYSGKVDNKKLKDYKTYKAICIISTIITITGFVLPKLIAWAR